MQGGDQDREEEAGPDEREVRSIGYGHVIQVAPGQEHEQGEENERHRGLGAGEQRPSRREEHRGDQLDQRVAEGDRPAAAARPAASSNKCAAMQYKSPKVKYRLSCS